MRLKTYVHVSSKINSSYFSWKTHECTYQTTKKPIEAFNENRYFNASANIQSSSTSFGYDIKNQMNNVVTQACNRQKANYFAKV